MYRGFNLDINWDDVDWYSQTSFDAGNEIYARGKRRVKRGIEKYLLDGASIDGEKMETEWFPLVKADLFISHSHTDATKAICLAGHLYEVFGLDCFVDSCVWENADELLKVIDDIECKIKGSNSYDYHKRNRSTSHIHMMLSAALLKMIDKTECLFFLKTPNSISTTTKKIISETESPWLYGELLFSSLVRRKTLAQHRPDIEIAKSFSGSGVLNESIFNIRHQVYTGHLTNISETALHLWELEYGHSLALKYPLDILYSLFKK